MPALVNELSNASGQFLISYLHIILIIIIISTSTATIMVVETHGS